MEDTVGSSVAVHPTVWPLDCTLPLRPTGEQPRPRGQIKS